MAATTSILNLGNTRADQATAQAAVKTQPTMTDHANDQPCECEARAAAMYKRARLIQILTIIFWAVFIVVLIKMFFR